MVIFNIREEKAVAGRAYPLERTKYQVQTIAILDGVCYIKGKNKLYSSLQTFTDEKIISSALFLKDILCLL